MVRILYISEYFVDMTEQETIELHKANLLFRGKLLESEQLSFDTISNCLPGWLHLNRLTDFGLVYISSSMENSLQKTSEEVKKEGPAFLDTITHTETKLRAVPLLTKLLVYDDESEVISFPQMIRTTIDQNYMPYYTAARISKKFSCTICQTIPFTALEINNNDLAHEYRPHLNKFRQFQSLTKREKEILKLIYLGETSKSMSEILNISYHTIRTHRKNIHKKLDAKRLNDLMRVAGIFYPF